MIEIVFTVLAGIVCLGLFGLGLALEALDKARVERNPEIADPSLFDLLQEIRGLKFDVVAGATSSTNIAISGIALVDTLLKVLQVEPDNGTTSTMLTDRTGEAAITSAGNIQLDTTDTSGKQLLVVWYDKVP